MFVHAREADSPTNMRYMGLLVDKYVPNPAKAKGSSWEGAGSCLPHLQTPLSSPFARCLGLSAREFVFIEQPVWRNKHVRPVCSIGI